MSGGAYEYVAGYVNNGDGNIARYGESLVNAEGKYKNVYYSTTTSGAYTPAEDYEYTNPNYAGTYPEGYSRKYGDAVWETSVGYSGNASWYSDNAGFPYMSEPFFRRGGHYGNTKSAGVFAFSETNGRNNTNFYGFRVVVTIL